MSTRKRRVVLEINAMNPLEAEYALEMMSKYITQKYEGDEHVQVHERIEVLDGDTDE